VQVHRKTDQVKNLVKKDLQGMFLVNRLSLCREGQVKPRKRYRQRVSDRSYCRHLGLDGKR